MAQDQGNDKARLKVEIPAASGAYVMITHLATCAVAGIIAWNKQHVYAAAIMVLGLLITNRVRFLEGLRYLIDLRRFAIESKKGRQEAIEYNQNPSLEVKQNAEDRQ